MIFKNLEFSFLVIVIMLLLNAQKRNVGGIRPQIPRLLWVPALILNNIYKSILNVIQESLKTKNKKQKKKKEEEHQHQQVLGSEQWS